VTIIAGCGIHCGGLEPEGHAGIHEFHVGRKAKVTYVEKHFATGRAGKAYAESDNKGLSRRGFAGRDGTDTDRRSG